MSAGESAAGSREVCATCQRVVPAHLRYCPACGADLGREPIGVHDEPLRLASASVIPMRSPITAPLGPPPRDSGWPAVLRHRGVLVGIGGVALLLSLVLILINFSPSSSGKVTSPSRQVEQPGLFAMAATHKPSMNATASATTALLPTAIPPLAPSAAPQPQAPLPSETVRVPDVTLPPTTPGSVSGGSPSRLPDQTVTASTRPKGAH